jgi:hypothetical protein
LQLFWVAVQTLEQQLEILSCWLLRGTSIIRGVHLMPNAALSGAPPGVAVTAHHAPPSADTHHHQIESDPPLVRQNHIIAPATGRVPLLPLTEQQKYEAMWAKPEYRSVAPGESIAFTFLQHAQPKVGSRVIDFGAGTGRGALALALFGNCRVHLVDFAANCLDEECRGMLDTQPKDHWSFTQHDLAEPLTIEPAEYGYCTDVLEHIPPEQVDKVLRNVLAAAQHVFFQISCVPDHCGALIGEPLHLSVHPYSWWHAKFRDELKCAVHWSEDRGDSCLFYVTAWSTGDEVAKAGVLNTEEETIRANVRANLAAGWTQVKPHQTNDLEVMLVGGGPSLKDSLEAICALRKDGAKLVTLNGAYNWCLEHGLTPSAQIVCDARPFNARFTHPVADDTRYLIGSQCDPSVLDGLPRERTYLWHTTAEVIRDILAEYEPWYGIPGGCTVLLRAIPLMRLLGYRKFHLFGCDSCVAIVEDGRKVHHAYAQPENEGHMLVPAIIGGKTFLCSPFMIAQAQEFMGLIKLFGNEFEIEVHGGGLLAWILEYAAQLDDGRELKIERGNS